MSDEEHVWIIDSIEEDVAAIEEDGERIRHVARWLLPGGAREGSILRVTRTASEENAIRIDIVIDRDAERAARDERRERPRSASDRGGDIVL
jgi:hypothetical protein